MSAITNINNTMSSAILLPTRGRLQQVQNTERQIAHIDKEIDAREKYIASNNEVISITKELIDLQKQQRQTIIESRDLDRKHIANNEKIIDILEDTNKKLQALVDRARRSKSAEPVLNTKTSELNKLDEIK